MRVEEIEENRELEMQKRMQEESTEELDINLNETKKTLKGIEEPIRKLGKYMVELAKRATKLLGMALEAKIQCEKEKRRRYEKHLKRVENRQRLYKKRKALGRI